MGEFNGNFNVIFLILLSILLTGCVSKIIGMNTEKEDKITGSAIIEQETNSNFKENKTETKIEEKKMTFDEIKEIMNNVFNKDFIYAKNKLAYSRYFANMNPRFTYYDPLSGDFLIIEGEIGDFKNFVESQSKMTYENFVAYVLSDPDLNSNLFDHNTSKYNVQTKDGGGYETSDYEVYPSFELEEYNEGNAYILKYKARVYDVFQGKTYDGKILSTPSGGSRIFVKCSSNFVIEFFPAPFGGLYEVWENLNEEEYDASIQNSLDFDLNSVYKDVDKLLKICES